MTKQEIQKLLDDWGFTKHCRHVLQTDDGEEVEMLEEWSNSDMSDFIIDEIL